LTRQDDFFNEVAKRNLVRVRVAGIVISEGQLLVQKPTDDPEACYAFIGGELELGDTFESRIKKEFEEETNAIVTKTEYLFVVENRFHVNGKAIHIIEHYLLVEIDRCDIESREPHLSQHWIPLNHLRDVDLRPHVVRNVISSGIFMEAKHLMTQFDE
jgi:ADP-ribose pyrophosphatase YjhB (NUDIX family)